MSDQAEMTKQLAAEVAEKTGVTVGEAHKMLLSCIAVARMRQRGQLVQLETRIANLEVVRR